MRSAGSSAAGTKDAETRGMSLVFLFAACAFALVLGCAVACVDRWREARLAAPRLRPVARIDGSAKAGSAGDASPRRLVTWGASKGPPSPPSPPNVRCAPGEPAGLPHQAGCPI